MTAYTARPDWFFGLAMNADPNDPAAVPVWSDYTAPFLGSTALGRGRQYELAQTLPIAPEVTIRDVSELLNPENTSSTFYGNILPYRGVLWMGTWPNPAAGNLMNTGAWRVPFDPSFESYTAAATVPWITAVGGTVPVIGTTTPHAGTKDLTYAVVNGATVQGVQWTCYVMPGRQYTVSAYVQQSSASTQGIYAAGSVGTTTATTGAYVRLTKTFTATAMTVTLAVLTSGTAVAGTVLVDDIQLEAGASASAFTTTGSVVAPVMNNFMERYSRTWGSQGFEGIVTLPCVDATAALSSIRIGTEYIEALAATVPALWYPLSDGASTTAFLDRSGNGGRPLLAVANKTGGAAAPTPATQIAITGDPGAQGVDINGTLGGAGSCLEAGGPTIPFVVPGPSATTPWAFSASYWFASSAPAASNVVFEVWFATGRSSRNSFEVVLVDANTVGVEFDRNGVADSQTGAFSTVAGVPHLFVLTVNFASATSLTYALWADGVQLLTKTINPTTVFGSSLDWSSNVMGLGGAEGLGVSGFLGSPGTYAHLATWTRVLSNPEIATLWNAGGLAYAGETSGTRVARHLVLGSYNGMARISAGSTTLGPATYSPDIDLTTDTQNSAEAEAGVTWIAPDGALVFEGRQDRWLRLTPSWTLGENVAGGEIPYLGDIEYDYDPQFLYANVQVTRNGGATAVGGSTADIATAVKRFFGRTFQQASDFATDQQAQDYANAVFYTHNRPATRIASITVDPAANPLLWPFVLGVEIGQRIRVVRRPKAANAGAGITVSLDFFVENVTHDQIDLEAGTWVTTLLCSPVGSVSSQTGVTFQPWILDDTTYSVLDSTTALGW